MHSKLEQIVDALNQVLEAKLQPAFPVGTMLFEGIVKPVQKGQEIINTIFLPNAKNGKECVFKDKHDLQVYHKIINPVQISTDTAGFENKTRVQARLRAVIYTRHDRFHLLEQFCDAVPSLLKLDGVFALSLNTNAVNVDDYKIFKEERGNIEYQLNPSWQLATVEYTINYQYNAIC